MTIEFHDGDDDFANVVITNVSWRLRISSDIQWLLTHLQDIENTKEDLDEDEDEYLASRRVCLPLW